MKSPSVEELEDPEYSEVWDRFEQHFAFRPGMKPDTWPAIREPADSITWSLEPLPDEPDYVHLDAMVAAVNTALFTCTPPDGSLLVLDWQHTCYRIRPHHLVDDQKPAWPKSMMPDGDYNIHLAEDFTYGTFGHPWEHTLCVFGTSLVEQVVDTLDEILWRRVREGGRPVNN